MNLLVAILQLIALTLVFFLGCFLKVAIVVVVIKGFQRADRWVMELGE